MTDKELAEYSQWLWTDIGRQLAQAAAIYGVLLTAYWTVVA